MQESSLKTSLNCVREYCKMPIPNILLVEDSKTARMAAKRILTKAGYIVTTAEDGEEALRLAESARPDVVLLDMLLPRLSGEQVLRRLKQNPATVHIPVIVTTALPRKNAPKLMEEGAAAFVEKEYLLDEILGLLAYYSPICAVGESIEVNVSSLC